MAKWVRFFIIIVFFASVGCSNNKGKYSILDPSASNYYGGASVSKVQNMPDAFEEYAIASNGKLVVAGELLTEGPLADISADEVSMDNARSVVSGNIIARKVSVSKNVRVACRNSVQTDIYRKPIAIRSVDSSLEEVNAVEKVVLKSDGNLYSVKEGQESAVCLSSLSGVWVYDSGTAVWTVSGKNVEINTPVVCETNMSVKADGIVFRAPVYVKGSFSAQSKFTIDTSEPFTSGLITDGNASINEAVIVGKMEIGGNLSVSILLDMIGTLKVDGDIELDGAVKINYLDTVYKSALVDVNSSFGSEVFLVHSQVFKDVNSNNAVALFTFVKGCKKITEESVFRKLENGTLVSTDYESILTGSTLDKGSSLEQEDGISSYYYNKLHVLKALDSLGHPEVDITESLFVEPDNLFHTFADSSTGEVLGTFKVCGGGLLYDDSSELVKLTDSSRKAISRAMSSRETASEDTSDPDYIDAMNSVPADEVKEKLQEGAVNAKAEEVETLTAAFPENPITTAEAQELVENKAAIETSGEALRVEEWRASKQVDVSTQIVAAEVEVCKSDNGEESKNCRRMHIRRTLRKIVSSVPSPVTTVVSMVQSTASGIGGVIVDTAKKFSHFCYRNHTQTGFLKGVDMSENDNWTTKYALLNIPNYQNIGDGRCGQISAMMLIRFLGGEVFNDPAMCPSVIDNFDRYAPTISSVSGIKNALQYLIDHSSNNRAWRTADALDNLVQTYHHGLRAHWEWWLSVGATDSASLIGAGIANTYITTIATAGLTTELHSQTAYNEIKNCVRANSGMIMNMNGHYGWSSEISWNKGHSVPIIGYQHRVYRIAGTPIIGKDKKYVYIHTTWANGNSADYTINYCFADKRKIRFDWYVNPNSLATFTKISR